MRAKQKKKPKPLKRSERRTKARLRYPSAAVTVTSVVYQKLIEMLIRGELHPGDVISERKLAGTINASRTPIREALGRLESEGLVQKQVNRGVTVCPFSAEALIEILDVRSALESEAARRAAGNMLPETIAEIRQSAIDLEKKSDRTLVDIWEADDHLHGSIAAAANNQLMASLIRDLRRRTHIFDAYRNPKGFGYAASEINPLLDAIEQGDGDRAAALMAQHIGAVRKGIIDKLSGAT